MELKIEQLNFEYAGHPLFRQFNLQLGAVGLSIDASGVHFSGPLVDHQGRVISP